MESTKCVFLCLILCISQSCSSVDGSFKDDIQKLKADLFYNYDASIIPLSQLSDVVQVQVQLSISAIVKIDMDNAMLESTGSILARWQDRSLSWIPAAYADIEKLKVAIAEIWNPEIAQLDMVGEFASSSLAFVEYTGMVTMVINSELRSFCKMDVSYYPRDTHTCTVVLFSASYPSSEVIMVPLTDSVNLANFKEHGMWWLKYSKVHTDTIQIADVNGTQVESSRIVNTIKVTRTSVFSFIHKGMPLILITVITFFCHIVPLNSGDRIPFSAAVFMALVFWMALIADDLPKQSSKVSLLSILMVITLCQSSVSVVTSVVLCRVSSIDNSTPIPNCLRCFAYFIIRVNRWCWTCVKRICCKSAPSKVYKLDLKGDSGGFDEVSNNEAECKSSTESEGRNSMDLESNVGSNVNSKTATGNKPSTNNDANGDVITWLAVANTLDNFVGVCSTIIILVIGIVFAMYYWMKLLT